MGWNESLFYYLYGFAHQAGWSDNLALFCANSLPVIVVVLLVIFLFSHEHSEKDGFHNIIVILLSAAFALVISYVVKEAVGDMRPYVVLANIHPLLPGTNPHTSFPSGHMTFFTAIATAVLFYHRGISVFFFLAAVIIGIARVVVGVHWPADIAAGALFGALISIVTYYGYMAIVGTWQRDELRS